MYELIQAGQQSYYIDCPAKMGIYLKNNSDVYLIDSGNDKDAGKKALKIINEKGWTLKGILNTHSHADHIGGNRYLQQQTGCKIFSTGIEAAFTSHTILEPSFLYGGYPSKELMHKFLYAEPSVVSDFKDYDFPKEVEIIQLKGHSFDMVGFKTPDGTVFLADCLSSKETLDKYRLGFIYDIAAYLDTLEMVKNIKAEMFVPSHAKAAKDITPLIQYNIDTVNSIANYIFNLCNTPISFEEILQKVFTDFELKMTPEQNVLVGSTVRSYITYLKNKSALNSFIENNIMKFKQ